MEEENSIKNAINPEESSFSQLKPMPFINSGSSSVNNNTIKSDQSMGTMLANLNVQMGECGKNTQKLMKCK